jgi:hypothetical protein
MAFNEVGVISPRVWVGVSLRAGNLQLLGDVTKQRREDSDRTIDCVVIMTDEV